MHSRLSKTILANVSPAALLLMIALVVISSVPYDTVSAQAEVKRELVLVRGNLYRFINNHHAGIVYVTRDGIIVGDPINKEAATWLKAELDKKFSLPVKYLFYSHHHADHVSGGEVFEEAGATVIAHKNAAQLLRETAVPTAAPTVLFDKQLTLQLGGKNVNLHYLGANHSEDMIVAEFPDEDAVFVVDFVSVERLPYRDLRGGKFPDWFQSIDALTKMPFTYLVPGHGNVGIKSDALEHGQYLRELVNRVARSAKLGLTLEEMQKTIKFPRYSDWANYDDWLPENIAGAYRIYKESAGAKAAQ